MCHPESDARTVPRTTDDAGIEIRQSRRDRRLLSSLDIGRPGHRKTAAQRGVGEATAGQNDCCKRWVAAALDDDRH